MPGDILGKCDILYVALNIIPNLINIYILNSYSYNYRLHCLEISDTHYELHAWATEDIHAGGGGGLEPNSMAVK